jgi:hypothetical protein
MASSRKLSAMLEAILSDIEPDGAQFFETGNVLVNHCQRCIGRPSRYDVRLKVGSVRRPAKLLDSVSLTLRI